MSPSQGLVLIIVAILIGELVLWRYRRRLIRDFDKPVLFRKGEIQIRDAIAGGIILAVIAQSVLGRVELDHERTRILKTATAQLVTNKRLERAEARLENHAMRLVPTDAELRAAYRRFLRACAADPKCKRDRVEDFRRIARIDIRGRIVPAVPDGPRMRPQPDGAVNPGPRPAPPSPIIRPPAQGDRRVPALIADVETLQAAVRDLRERKPFDSGALDGLDNRITDLERGLASLLNRLTGIDRVLGILCRPPLRICA